MKRRLRRATTRTLAVALACLGFVGVAAAESPIGDATGATDRAQTTLELAADPLFVAAGGLLIGLGVGLVVASALTYWHKNRQIRRRLHD
ncbi:hypothetical protein [Natronobacterium texcoconense]|uniref:Uncharacterized protein n=1 Tax=Natronobacterium texcoconense TaxID=1095778 RepID=A0A1H1J3U0_NATTX|nr:hypothetical protein [Natronobacterium texcoconense]SDR44168.1 hypothetical protein SAMN04489842_4060 [Natronobacterium texcoconense]